MKSQKYTSKTLLWEVVKSNIWIILLFMITNCAMIFFADVLGIFILAKLDKNNLESVKKCFMELIKISSLYALYMFIKGLMAGFLEGKTETMARSKTYKKLQSIPYEDFVYEHESYYVEILDKASDNISKIIEYSCERIVPFVINMYFMLGWLYKINTTAFWTVLCSVILDNIIVQFLSSGFISKYARQHMHIHGEVKSFMNDDMRTRIMSEFFDNHEYQSEKLNKIQDEERSVIFKNAFRTSLIRTIRIAIFLATFFAIYLLLPEISSTKEGIETIPVIYLILKAINKCVYQVAEYAVKISDCWQKLQTVDKIFSKESINRGKEIEFQEQLKEIQISNLTFSYNENKILDNLNCTIPAGSVVTVVGKSGVGKTTLLNIIAGIMNKYTGSVKLNNTEIFDISKSSIKNNISYIFSSQNVSNDTLENNLRIANKNATEEEINEAIKISSLSSVVEGLKNGLKSEVGGGETSLSTGQRRRLMIAIGTINFSRSQIVLMDEPFSSIDEQTARVIFNNLMKIKENRTYIITDHTKITAEKSDFVIYIESPKKFLVDKHINLISKNKSYEKLFQSSSDERKTAEFVS